MPKLRKRCNSCLYSKSTRWKKRIANGRYQLVDICDRCSKNFHGPGINIPHALVDNLDELPLLADYAEDMPPCERCGKSEGVELHHWAQVHIFGIRIAEEFPKSYLCPGCHQEWHTQQAAHRVHDCIYCKRLRKSLELSDGI